MHPAYRAIQDVRADSYRRSREHQDRPVQARRDKRADRIRGPAAPGSGPRGRPGAAPGSLMSHREPRDRTGPRGHTAPIQRGSVMSRRAPGEGSLFYDRQRGVWVGSVDVGRNPKTGRRIRRKVSDPDKKACREALDELRVILKATGNVPRRDTTVRQLVEDWLANPPPTVTSDITRTKHRDAAVRINAALGHVPALKLDADMVEALLRGMADDGFATKTIVMTRSVLVRSLNRGQRNKLLTQNVGSRPRSGVNKTTGVGSPSRATNSSKEGTYTRADTSIAY